VTSPENCTPDTRWQARFQRQGDLADLVSHWQVGEAVPAGIADVLQTARRLIVDSYYEYDYTLVAGAWGWLIVEACLRGCMPAADEGKDRRTFGRLVEQAREEGLISKKEAGVLIKTVELRNSVFHRAHLKPKPAPESYLPDAALQMLEAVHDCVSDIYARAANRR
jgi:hypothetical protein